MISKFLAAAVALWFSTAGALIAGDDQAANILEAINRDVSALYQKSKAAVVRVHAMYRPALGTLTLTPPRRVGTGFFLRPDGTLLTAATIVDGAENCTVEINGERVPARPLGCDPRCNLAVLKIDRAGRETPVLPRGDPDDLHIGSMVVAIGFPFELPSAPTVGFVGGRDIRQGNHVFPTTHLRASCRLSPGQAGSPLLNARGELVGVAVAAHQDDHCYALPITAARKIWTDILTTGAAQYGWVGLEVTEKNPADPYLVVAQVFSNTPAATAGFVPGDTLVRIETNTVRSLADLMDTMFYRKAGDRVAFTVSRNEEERELIVVVGSYPGASPAKPAADPLRTLPVGHDR